MSTFVYNGIRLEILKTHLYRAEVEYNGPDKLVTTTTLHFSAQLNPQATSYDIPGVSGPEPVARLGNPGSMTLVAIQEALMTPRQGLLWFIESPGPPFGPQVLLSLDTTYDPPDSKYGPEPLYAEIKEIAGTKTLEVYFGIRFSTQDSYRNSGYKPLVLSNRWSMSQALDTDLYTTQTMQGVTVFDLHQLAVNGFSPDDFRQFLIPPPPPGFRRSDIQVEQQPDGRTLTWTIVDREEAVHVKYPDIQRIEILVGFEQNTNVAGGILKALKSASAGKITDFAMDVLSWVPFSTGQLVIKVYGRPSANRDNLLTAAWLVLLNYFPVFAASGVSPAALAATGGTKLKVVQDVTGKYLELHAEVNMTLRFAGDLLNQRTSDVYNPVWPPNSTTSTYTVPDVTEEGYIPVQSNPQFSGTRSSSYLSKLMTAFLAQPGSLVSLPAQVPVNPPGGIM